MIARRRTAAAARATGLVLASLVLLGACAARPPPPPALLPVPLISQARPWSCGAAALMAALVYFGKYDEAESGLHDELGVTPEQGTRATRIVAVARRFGLAADARTKLTLADLESELGRGAVVIIALQAWPTDAVASWGTRWEDGHYVVVVGLSADLVYVMDPSVRTGYAYLTRQQLESRWHDYEIDGGRRVVYDRLGIVLRGDHGLARYPAPPVPVE